MNGSALVLAYHGCDATVRDDLVAGRLPTLSPSRNAYDWLGSGIYFFEADERRARLFAQTAQAHPERRYTRQPIATAAVVGAVLRVGRWLDMTTQEGLDHFRIGLTHLQRTAAQSDLRLPTNEAADDHDGEMILRHLDRSVFEMIHALREMNPATTPPIQAVRAAFYQGDPLAPSSEFRERTHIQIALRDPSCVLAWFLPPQERLLSDAEHALAAHALRQARETIRALKTRVRAKARS